MHVEPAMANLNMARAIFHSALMHHHIDGIVAGDDVEKWLQTYGGWFPDEQADYGYGCLMPLAPEAINSAKALEDAKQLMDRLNETLEDENLLLEARAWLQGAAAAAAAASASSLGTRSGAPGCASSNLTEANLEAKFRLEFAHETLQSFARSTTERDGISTRKHEHARRIDNDMHIV